MVEVFGYVATVICYVLGFLSTEAFVSFLLLATGLGLLLSITSLLLEEMVFHTYRNTRNLFVLIAAAVFENLGYRQLTAFWRFEGLLQWIFSIETKRDVVTRNATLQTEKQTDAATGKTLSPAPVNQDVTSKSYKEKITT